MLVTSNVTILDSFSLHSCKNVRLIRIHGHSLWETPILHNGHVSSTVLLKPFSFISKSEQILI